MESRLKLRLFCYVIMKKGAEDGMEINWLAEVEKRKDDLVNAGIFNYNHADGGSIQLNIRFPLNNDYPHTIEMITKKAETCDFTIAEAQQFSTHYIPADHPMIKTLQSAYQLITGDEPTLLTSGGAMYATLMKNVVDYGAIFPGKVDSSHQIDEFIEIDDLIKATAIYAKALYELSHL